MSIRLYLLLCVALFAALGCGKKAETTEEQPIAELKAIPQSQADKLQGEVAGHKYVDLGLSVLLGYRKRWGKCARAIW